jgi:prophage regulatory protein
MKRYRVQDQREPAPPTDSGADATMAFLVDIRGKRRSSTNAPPQSDESPAALACSPEIRLIRLSEVLAICGKSRSSVYELIQKGAFPAPVKLGGRSSAWIKAEVLAWVESCIRASRGQMPAK